MCALTACSTDSFEFVLLRLRMLSMGHMLVPSAPILPCVLSSKKLHNIVCHVPPMGNAHFTVIGVSFEG